MFAMAGLLLASCADKDVIGEGGQQGEGQSEGYMSLNINLPTTPMSRAANDIFDDGEEYEYRVSDCALLLFEGNDESTATLLNAQSITYPFDNEVADADDDQITTSYQVVAKVDGHTAGKPLWALALLNYKNVMSIDISKMPTFENVRTLGNDGKEVVEDVTLDEASTLNDVRNLITKTNLSSLIGSFKNYFFMTNAVLSKGQGGKQKPGVDEVFQLAYMNPKYIYETVEDARKQPAGEIFVERAVAKATLNVKGATVKVITGNGADDFQEWEIDPDLTEWAIDNMEPATYIARNPGIEGIEKNWPYITYTSGYFPNGYYRFVGEVSTKYNNVGAIVDNDYYRTYWCIDPQYNNKNMTVTSPQTSTAPEKRNSVGMVAATTFSPIGHDNPLYCFENTFDVEHQSYRNTTRAIIKVTLKDKKGNLYTVNGSLNDKEFYTEEDAKSYVLKYIVDNKEVKDVFKKNLTSTEYGIDKNDFDVTYKRNEAGLLQVETLKLSENTKNKTNDDGNPYFKNWDTLNKDFNELVAETGSDGKSKLISGINSSVVICEYVNGVMYYEARFKHFAGSTPGVDDLAPWNVKATESLPNNWESTPSGGSTNASYDWKTDSEKAANNYLGRYGMVRNNWYYVDVEAFNKLGYPADPSGQVENKDFEDPDTPDDDIQEYISAKIHVLSWAKRTQGWSF